MIGQHCVYPVDESIADFDLNTDIEEYNYDGRTVFRGNMDPEFSKEGRKVYWPNTRGISTPASGTATTYFRPYCRRTGASTTKPCGRS